MSFSSVYYQFLSKLKRFISLIIVLSSKHCKKYKIDADIDVKYGAQCTSWDTSFKLQVRESLLQKRVDQFF